MQLQSEYFNHPFKYKMWILIALNTMVTISFERLVIGNKSIRVALKRYEPPLFFYCSFC